METVERENGLEYVGIQEKARFSQREEQTQRPKEVT